MTLKNKWIRFISKSTAMILLCFSCGISAQPSTEGVPAGKGSYQDLIKLLDEFVEFRDPTGENPYQIIRDRAGQAIDPVMDYSQGAITAQREKVSGFLARLRDMNVASWSRAQQVDYLAVRSRVNQADFILQISRPWARDPGFYVDRMLQLTFTDLPVAGADLENLLARLRAIPVLIDEAQKHLDDVAADYADLAIHNLGQADGVGHGYPYRAKPPAGVLGWYDDLLVRAEVQPDLVSDITGRPRCRAGI